MCPTVENPDLILQETGDCQGPAHYRLAECGSIQAIQARPDHPERVVSPAVVIQLICNRLNQSQIDLFATRFNNKLAHFVTPVSDPLAWAVDALSLSCEDLDPYLFMLAYPPP